MKAALYQGIHNIEIADLPDYECEDNAIVLKIFIPAYVGQMLQYISMEPVWGIGLRSVENSDMKRYAEFRQSAGM